jgi:hypothetical protein
MTAPTITGKERFAKAPKDILPISLKKIELNAIGDGIIRKLIALFKCKLQIETVIINGKTDTGDKCDYTTGTLNKTIHHITQEGDGTYTVLLSGNVDEIMRKIKNKLKPGHALVRVLYNSDTNETSTKSAIRENFADTDAGVQVSGVANEDVSGLVDAATAEDAPEEKGSNLLFWIIIILILILALVNIYLLKMNK